MNRGKLPIFLSPSAICTSDGLVVFPNSWIPAFAGMMALRNPRGFRRNLLFFLPLCLVFVCLFPTFAWAGIISPELQQKIDSSPPESRHPVILRFLEDSPVDKLLLKGRPKAFRNKTVIQTLRRAAAHFQPTLLKVLDEKQRKGKAGNIRPLWIVNAIAVEASADLIKDLAASYPNIEILPDHVITLGVTTLAQAGPSEWNLQKIKAPDLWALGYSGQGVVVATLDTGVDIDHPDLMTRYRGGGDSWYDPYSENATPADASHIGNSNLSGHGTGVTGVIVGGDSSGTAIGVAPDAQWIAAKIFPNIGNTNDSKILLALQWVLDPDSNPNTSDAPDVVNNSWGPESSAASSCDSIFQVAVQNVRQAGIFPVFASGNSGWPILPAAYSESIAVGSTDSNDAIASNSGHGSTACRTVSDSVYPNLVAPGEGIRTADLTFGGLLPDSYTTVSGTSFASPHVAGAAALLFSAFPGLTVDDLETALSQSAVDLGAVGPDSVYGNGRVNVKAAFDYIVNTLQIPARPAPPSDVAVKNTAAGTFTVSWTASASSSVGLTYTLTRNGSDGSVVVSGLTGSPYLDTSVTDAGSYTYSVVAVASNLSSDPAVGLLGNINQGNVITRDRIDGFDLATLMAALGANASSSNWNAAADLNGDGTVDATDRDILSAHFGQVKR